MRMGAHVLHQLLSEDECFCGHGQGHGHARTCMLVYFSLSCAGASLCEHARVHIQE